MNIPQEESPTIPRVLAVIPGASPSPMIYIVKPLSALAQRGQIHFHSAFEKAVTLHQIHHSDLVVFSRNYDEQYNHILQEVVGNRIPCVYDLDDNFWELSLDIWVGRYFRAPFRLQQIEKYLLPLLKGDIRSCFSMTEPQNAGSNPLLMDTFAVRDGNEYIINGHKWFTSSADGADFAIVMAVTNPTHPNPYKRTSQIIVPTETKGGSGF